MYTIIIIIVIIVIYFVIVGIKENETREAVDRERRISNKKIANIHFENLVTKEIERQKILEETRKIFIKQLEKEDGIHRVSFDENILIIVLENDLDEFQANNEAKVWIETLMPSTGVDIVKIYNSDGEICGLADRNNENLFINNISSIKEQNNQDNDIYKPNEIDKTKFRISMMFYQFCFSDQTAKIFLEDNSMSENISKGLMVSRFQLQKINILESILKIYLKKNHRIELGEGSSGFYTINDYRFFIDTIRVTIEKNDSYFEILYNDFENVKDENGNEMSIAKEFILYVKNFKPQAIFVLVHDSILDKYALRRVTEEGVNFKLTFLKNNEGSESIDFLKDYILNNNL